MEAADTKPMVEKEEVDKEPTAAAPEVEKGGNGGGGWGGWGFSPLSYLSDLQKAAAVAAEEISRNVNYLSVCLSIYLSIYLFRPRCVLIKP